MMLNIVVDVDCVHGQIGDGHHQRPAKTMTIGGDVYTFLRGTT